MEDHPVLMSEYIRCERAANENPTSFPNKDLSRQRVIPRNDLMGTRLFSS